MSVTGGFHCVEFRKFFQPRGETEIKPMRKGVALRLGEWTEMREVIESINVAYPELGTALPCYLQDDHSNQEAAFQYRECYPFNPFVAVY